MAFSNEDRKQVCHFFEKILLKIKEPIFYENLRGHITKAPPVVKKFVLIKCKGENLLKYFQTRKNYFDVNFRSEVSLSKDRYKLLISEMSKLHDNDENNITKESFDESEYPISSVIPISNDGASNKSLCKSVDENFPSFVEAVSEEMTKHKEITEEYFCEFLNGKGRINVDSIKIGNLPKEIRSYIKKQYLSELISFFQSNPELFRINGNNYVSLVHNFEFPKNSPKKLQFDLESSISVEMDDKSIFAKMQTIKFFFYSVEFFRSKLKRESSIPLKKLHISLSQAPPGVSEYIKSSHKTLSKFFRFTSYLFTLNENNEVSLTEDCSKLLKRAEKRLNSDLDLRSLPMKEIINVLFQPEHHAKISNIWQGDKKNCSTDRQQLEFPAVSITGEDILHSVNDIVSEYKKDNVYKKFKASESANVDIKFSNNCKDKIDIQEVDDQVVVEKTAAMHVTNELKNSALDNRELKASVYPVCEVADENNFCISSNERIKKDTHQVFIECTFIAQLLCLEIIEKEKILTLNFEYEAVNYFVNILEENFSKYSVLSLEKGIDINLLKGKLGQASNEIKNFMKHFYKGEKMISFFQTHKEFILNLPIWIKLSPDYKECLENRMILYKAFSRRIKLYKLHALYDLHFHHVFADVFDCLLKVCCFLQNKSNTKLSRVCGIFSKFSTSQQDFMNSLSGSEKMEVFLLYFKKVFNFSDKCIKFNPEIDAALLVSSITKFSETLKTTNVSNSLCFHYLLDYAAIQGTLSLDFDELDVIESVQNYLSNKSSFNYSDLPDIVNFEVLYSLVLENKDSRNLIKLLEDCNLFELKNGLIFKKNHDQVTEQFNESSEHLDTNVTEDVDNSFCNMESEYLEKEDSRQCEEINRNALCFDETSSSQHLNANVIESVNNSPYNMETEHLHKKNENARHVDTNVVESIDSYYNIKAKRVYEKREIIETEKLSESTLIHEETSYSQQLDANVIQNVNNSVCNIDKTLTEDAVEQTEHFSECASNTCEDLYFHGLKTSLYEIHHKNNTPDNLSEICLEMSLEEKHLEEIEGEGKKLDSFDVPTNVYGKDKKYEHQLHEFSNNLSTALTPIEDSKLNKNIIGDITANKLQFGSVTESDISGSLKLNNKLGDYNQEVLSDKDSHINLSNSLSKSEFVETRSEKPDNMHKSRSHSDLSSEENCKAQLVAKDHSIESDKVHDVGLSFTSFEEAEKISECALSHEEPCLQQLGANFIQNVKNNSICKIDKSLNEDVYSKGLETVSSEILLKMSLEEIEGEGKKSDIFEKDEHQLCEFNSNLSATLTPLADSELNQSTVGDIAINKLGFGSVTEFDNTNGSIKLDNKEKTVKSSKRSSCDLDIVDENLLKGTSSSDNMRLKEESFVDKNGQIPVCDKIFVSCDNKSAEIVNDANFVSKGDFEIKKDNSDLRVKAKGNLNVNSPEENMQHAYLISKNHSVVNARQDDVKDGEIKEASKPVILDIEHGPEVNKELIKEKLPENILAPKNAFEDGRNDKKEKVLTKCSKICDDIFDSNSARNKNELIELTENVGDLPVSFDCSMMNSKSACIYKNLKSKNRSTDISHDDHVKSSVEEKLLKENNEIRVAKENPKQTKEGISNNSSSLFSITEVFNLNPTIKKFTTNQTVSDKCSVMRKCRNELKSTFIGNEPFAYENLVVMRDSDLNIHCLKSTSNNYISGSESQDTHSKHTVASKGDSEPSPAHRFHESHESSQNFDENCDKSEVSYQNFDGLVLQPLQSKVILLTMDSCVVETVINGCKKHVFCLKSNFHCDVHTDCLNCFDSLSVGDSVLCYIPPNTDYKSGNVCISFMLCKDSNVNREESKMPSQESFHHKEKSKSLLQGKKYVNYTKKNYSSLKCTESKVGECQVNFSEEIKPPSSVAKKESEAKSITVSQSSQTVEYQERKLCTVEKGCQIDVSTIVQGTQTVNESTESEYQAVFGDTVEPCSTIEKACQIKYPVLSQSVQASCNCDVNECQTDISGDIKSAYCTSSSRCQTDLSGPVKKCVYILNKSSQVCLVPYLVNQTTQTAIENDTALDSNQVPQPPVTLQANVQNASASNRSLSDPESPILTCDTACQTISTGTIMIKTYFM